MSEQHSFEVGAHKNIYTNTTGRELRIDFSVPDNGVNSDTGIVVLIPGFGGNIDSNVYQKMRNRFADDYNMVTIQCDYFGSEYMQSKYEFSFNTEQLVNDDFTDAEIILIKKNPALLPELLREKSILFTVDAKLGETIESFNDMSFMQAIDVITSIEAVKLILEDNNLEYDKNRVIVYGQSHGAYLAHLSNILYPHLITYIIDNSAWLEPIYLSKTRSVFMPIGKGKLKIDFTYLARELGLNKKALTLENLYRSYNGNTQIITFQGNVDNLIDYNEKRKIINHIQNSEFFLITEKDIDGKIFKSNTHGLQADFLELFSLAMKYETRSNVEIKGESYYKQNLSGINVEFNTEKGLPMYEFDFGEK